MVIERDADDVARTFALEQLLYEHGWDRAFSGEVTGLIGAGAFIAFGVGDDEAVPAYEGMLPVRRMSASVLQGGDAPQRAGRRAGARSERNEPRPVMAARGRAERGRDGAPAEREWWELNEQGTVLFAAGSGAALRLGDPVLVRVQRVEPVRGRVDLGPPRGGPDG